MENHQVATVQTVSLSQYKPETLAVLKDTVAKGASNEELGMFLTLAGKYQLDPFAKEIFFIKRKDGSVTIMTSRDGYLAIAQRHPEYEGLVSATVRQKDEFEFDAMNGTVKHKPNIMEGHNAPIVGSWAIAYRKDRKPAAVYVPFSEYKQGGPTWGSYPSAMIEKVAEARALKRQFGISGLVTREELEDTAPAVPSAPTAPVNAIETETAPEEPTFKRGVERVYDLTVEKVRELAELLEKDPEDAEQMVQVKAGAKFGAREIYDLSKKEMEEVLGDVVTKIEAVKAAKAKVTDVLSVETVDTEDAAIPAEAEVVTAEHLTPEQVEEMFGEEKPTT